MPDVDFEKLARLAIVSDKEIGSSEEEVKVNFAVPLLEALGHSRLQLEYKQKDIVVRAGKPRQRTVIVETKRAGEPLDRHLAQLERYAKEESCFLAVLTNGDEIRLYALPWPGVASFEEALVWEIGREDLANPTLARDLAECLSAVAMASGAAPALIATRQEALNGLREKDRRIQEQAERRRAELSARMAELDKEREAIRIDLARVDADAEEATAELYAWAAVRRRPRPVPAAEAPVASEAPSAKPPAARPSGAGKPWREEQLFADAGQYQRKVLGAFVKSGRRTLGTKELAGLTGLSFQQTHGALSGFTNATRRGSREPLFEVTKPIAMDRAVTGVLYTVVEKYWDTLVRLYSR